MEKKHFLLKSLSRPTFQADMTPEERAIMMQHIAYWGEKVKAGICIVYGPVMEPTGIWGLGIVEVTDENEVRRLIDLDPANIHKLMEYHYYPMKVGMSR